MNRTRFPWYLLVGLALGLMAGMVGSLAIAPLRYVQTSPAALNSEDKDFYRGLIALSYLADGDLGRASARLALLKDSNPVDALAAQSQRVFAQGGSIDEAQALSLLAVSLHQKNQNNPTVSVGTPLAITENVPPTVDITQAATFTPLPTFTPRPTPTITPTQGAPFALVSREQVCDPNILPALIQVEVYDAGGVPIFGVPITVTWDGCTNTFYTGLFPQMNEGYADFQMNADVVYTLQAGVGGERVPNLQSPQCTKPDGSTYWGGWKLIFKQP
jgi:hypothetical protein